jgi:hypothetical protein
MLRTFNKEIGSVLEVQDITPIKEGPFQLREI